jgi:hypothetical protein
MIRTQPNTKEYRENYEKIFQNTTNKLKTKCKVEIWSNENGFIIHSWHRNLENALINAEVLCKSRKVKTQVIRGGLIEQIFEPDKEKI